MNFANDVRYAVLVKLAALTKTLNALRPTPNDPEEPVFPDTLAGSNMFGYRGQDPYSE